MRVIERVYLILTKVRCTKVNKNICVQENEEDEESTARPSPDGFGPPGHQQSAALEKG